MACFHVAVTSSNLLMIVRMPEETISANAKKEPMCYCGASLRNYHNHLKSYHFFLQLETNEIEMMDSST